MALAAPSMQDLFGGLPADKQVDAFEAYKTELSKCYARTDAAVSRGEIEFVKGTGIVKKAGPVDHVEALRAQVAGSIDKGLMADDAAAIQGTLDRLADIQKDWTTTNPLTGSVTGNYGLVPYDLDSALAMLVPRSFVVRNQIARTKGIGQAAEYRRILGVSNSGTGGVSNLSTFFTSQTASTAFGGGAVNLQRPGKISYAADRQIRGYVEQGVSDEVMDIAQYQGQGYTDLRALSHTALTWATMLGEERNFLNGRSSGTSYLGAIATPVVTGANLTSAAATTTGGTFVGGTDTVYYKLTYSSSFGESVATAEQSRAVTASNNSVTLTFSAIPANALAVNVYFGTVSGTYTNKVTSTASTITLLTAGTGSYTAPAADGSASAYGFDGLVSAFTDPTTAGYVKRLNSTLSTSEPGGDFQDGLASLFTSVLADPDVVLTTAAIRRELSKNIQSNSGTTGYRLNLQSGDDGVTIGSVINGLTNESTGKVVDLQVSPYLPAGVALLWSKTLPFPDSGVTTTSEFRAVQDLMVIDWPRIQMSSDASTYILGTMLHKAPAWSGAITGIQ